MSYDAIVIGGSFAGLSAAIYIARARRSVCVIDAGSPRNRFAEASHGFFGQDGNPPLEMIAQGREKLLAYPSVSFISGVAESVRGSDGDFTVQLSSGEELQAKKLVLAYGISDDLPKLPGLTEHWGKTVLHCPYCHGFEFSGQPLGVLWAMPHSSQQALLISEWGPTTFYLNGKGELSAEERRNLAIRNVQIEPAPLRAVEAGPDGKLNLLFADGRTQSVAALYTGTQSRMNSPIAEQLGCAFEDSHAGPIIQTDAMKMTSVPGVFAAGDITRAMTNATFASADGVMAGSAVHRQLLMATLEYA